MSANSSRLEWPKNTVCRTSGKPEAGAANVAAARPDREPVVEAGFELRVIYEIELKLPLDQPRIGQPPCEARPTLARGSALETRGHLATARQREYISRDEEIAVSGLYQDLADMLGGFIAYLRRSDRKDRW